MVISDFYRQLDALTGSPVVRLNRAVAVAEAGDLPAAFALLDGLEDSLGRTHRLSAVRADLLRRAGREEEALASYRLAVGLCGSDAERTALQRRIDDLR